MDCLFCKIVSKQISAQIILDEPDVLAFRDIHPVAPKHVLVIPKVHIASLAHVSNEHADVLGKLLVAAQKVAESEQLLERGFRCVFNTGPDANQTVHHVHMHVIGGRTMSWPPG